MGEIESGAMFSHDRRYRYRLTRRIGDGEQAVMFLMLNPSKADEVRNDNTITKCVRFAEKWGFDVMHVVNLSPLMATSPAELLAGLPEPVEVRQRNMEVIEDTVAKSSRIVLAYGNHADNLAKAEGARGRVSRLTRLLRDSGHGLHCLGVTAKGHPRHPVRIAYDTALETYEP